MIVWAIIALVVTGIWFGTVFAINSYLGAGYYHFEIHRDRGSGELLFSESVYGESAVDYDPEVTVMVATATSRSFFRSMFDVMEFTGCRMIIHHRDGQLPADEVLQVMVEHSEDISDARVRRWLPSWEATFMGGHATTLAVPGYGEAVGIPGRRFNVFLVPRLVMTWLLMSAWYIVIIRVIKNLRASRRVRRGLCTQCGYPLDVDTDHPIQICPECGTQAEWAFVPGFTLMR